MNRPQRVVSEIVEVLLVLPPDGVAAELLTVLIAIQHDFVQLVVERVMPFVVSVVHVFQLVVFGVMASFVFLWGGGIRWLGDSSYLGQYLSDRHQRQLQWFDIVEAALFQAETAGAHIGRPRFGVLAEQLRGFELLELVRFTLFAATLTIVLHNKTN